MNVTQEYLDQVRMAQSTAATNVNADGEIFYNTAGNWEILRRLLVREHIPQENWTNEQSGLSPLFKAGRRVCLQAVHQPPSRRGNVTCHILR